MEYQLRTSKTFNHKRIIKKDILIPFGFNFKNIESYQLEQNNKEQSPLNSVNNPKRDSNKTDK